MDVEQNPGWSLRISGRVPLLIARGSSTGRRSNRVRGAGRDRDRAVCMTPRIGSVPYRHQDAPPTAGLVTFSVGGPSGSSSRVPRS